MSEPPFPHSPECEGACTDDTLGEYADCFSSALLINLSLNPVYFANLDKETHQRNENAGK